MPLLTRVNQLSRAKRLLAGASIVAVFAIGAAGPALADNVTGTVGVTGGILDIVAADPPTFAVTLDGTDKLPTDTFAFAISDLTGTGAGWDVQMTSTTFTSGSHTLDTDASAITGVSAVSTGGGTYTNPTNGVTYPVTVPAGTTAPAAATIFEAADDTGMGVFTITPTMEVSVPANTYAGTYTSTITLSVVSGP